MECRCIHNLGLLANEASWPIQHRHFVFLIFGLFGTILGSKLSNSNGAKNCQDNGGCLHFGVLVIGRDLVCTVQGLIIWRLWWIWCLFIDLPALLRGARETRDYQ